MKMENIRCIIKGMVFGTFIYIVFAILISLRMNTGEFYPVIPAIAKEYKNELIATIIHIGMFCWLSVFAGYANRTARKHELPKGKQILEYVIFLSIAQIPMAAIYHWENNFFVGICNYLLISLLISLILYLVELGKLKKDINEIRKAIYSFEVDVK